MQRIAYDLRALVVEEIYCLRDYTTATEKDNLNFWSLRPGDCTRSLLGQLTGRTPNDRANHLTVISQTFGTPYDQLGQQYGMPNIRLATDIYMRQRWAENKKIVEFIQGKRHTITPDDL